MLQSSQDISDNDYEDDAPTQLVTDEPTLSKEEQERIRAEREEEEHKKNLQMYVFVARCVAYHFNAKQPTDMARRQVKVTKQDLARIKERFQAFLKGETNIATDEAFAKAMHSYCEVFRCNVEKRIRSLPDIEGLSKDTVLTSWMTKFDTITKGDEEAQGRTARGRARNAPSQPNADVILGKEQLYDMFQQVLGVKKFEHQIIFNALQMRKIMPKFVVKDMETLFMDEVRQSINLLISNLESVPVTPRGQAVGKRKDKSR
ncbi:hypothetical protein TELCIR_00435 [Teladorsagia circumcincta]|uniref:Calcium-dependent secretion activator n=1 Tax=Teladorsagia circumcincta TaxID=45464 RepID=A0A2G9V654_TELCI|nr:hypothetical protein TELCIR_00435 [Teladorsagia circumcincta]